MRRVPLVVLAALVGAVLALAAGGRRPHTGAAVAAPHGVGTGDVVWYLVEVAGGVALGAVVLLLARWSRARLAQHDRRWQLAARITVWAVLAVAALAVPLADRTAGVVAIALVVNAAAAMRWPTRRPAGRAASSSTSTTPATSPPDPVPVGFVAWPDCAQCGGRGTRHGRPCECVTPVYPTATRPEERSTR